MLKVYCALHAVLCAAGFNIRWLLRAIVRLGLEALLLCLRVLTALAWEALCRSTTDSDRSTTIDHRLAVMLR